MYWLHNSNRESSYILLMLMFQFKLPTFTASSRYITSHHTDEKLADRKIASAVFYLSSLLGNVSYKVWTTLDVNCSASGNFRYIVPCRRANEGRVIQSERVSSPS